MLHHDPLISKSLQTLVKFFCPCSTLRAASAATSESEMRLCAVLGQDRHSIHSVNTIEDTRSAFEQGEIPVTALASSLFLVANSARFLGENCKSC
jgi:hypothetical protein